MNCVDTRRRGRNACVRRSPTGKRMAIASRDSRCTLARNGISDMRKLSSKPFTSRLLRALTRLLTMFGNEPVRAYRPEAHYMRGPGPAWRAKHGEG
jgi:hypothetical protein